MSAWTDEKQVFILGTAQMTLGPATLFQGLWVRQKIVLEMLRYKMFWFGLFYFTFLYYGEIDKNYGEIH